MRLGRRVKFNMIIAILLCMVFVVNVGVTLAASAYSFYSKSANNNNNGIDHNTYTHFESMNGTQGQYVYSTGTYNNQLSVNYGFNQKYDYDLMIAFTATYTSTTHKANDFSINFVNRNKWCVDMGTATMRESTIVEGNTQEYDKVYYTTGSSTNTLSGVMYYMGTLNGSGDLPVISSVTFHTEQKDSWAYEGDMLTITLTPYYVKEDSNNYGDSHKFNSTSIAGFTKNEEAFDNWVSYMSTTGTVASATSHMIYNSYVDDDRSLAYPYDSSVMTTGDDNTPVVDTQLKKQPIYANTAYRYRELKTTTEDGEGKLSTTIDRTYASITAGNRMYGGLGVYVIPASNLVTVNIGFSYKWQNNGIVGTANSGMVEFDMSDDIQTIVNNKTNYHYYHAQITQPTYIDVFDYITLTAEGVADVIKGNYSLILTNITVEYITSVGDIVTDDTNANNVWTAEGTNVAQNTTVTVDDKIDNNAINVQNSTSNNPVLVRVRDIALGGATYATDISITNNKLTPMAITSFTITSDLWYGLYETVQGSSIEQFNKTWIGEGYLNDNSLIYDSNIWTCGRQTLTKTVDNAEIKYDVFTFTLNSGKAVYIPSGYSLTLVSGVDIVNPNSNTATEVGQVVEYADDFWCNLELTSITANTTSVDYTQTTSKGVEVVAEGYYNVINSSNDGAIYIRNNTRQIITSVSLQGLKVYSLYTEADNTGSIDYTTFKPRDRSTGNNATITETQHLPASVSIKPGEMVKVCTIESANDAIIYDFNLSVTLEGSEEASDIDLLYNENNDNVNNKKGIITNNGTKYYEFRLASTTQLTDVLASDAFIERKISDTEYYYYYIGILCPNRSITIFNSFAPNVEVQYLEHSANADENYYVASNYPSENDGWGLDETLDAEWLNAMKKLYQKPTDGTTLTADKYISAPTLD